MVLYKLKVFSFFPNGNSKCSPITGLFEFAEQKVGSRLCFGQLSHCFFKDRWAVTTPRISPIRHRFQKIKTLCVVTGTRVSCLHLLFIFLKYLYCFFRKISENRLYIKVLPIVTFLPIWFFSSWLQLNYYSLDIKQQPVEHIPKRLTSLLSFRTFS